MYCYSSAGPGLRWKAEKEQADQLTTSPSGDIVWRVWNSSLYVATKVSIRSASASKWVEAAREVAFAALDDRAGWCVQRLSKAFSTFSGNVVLFV